MITELESILDLAQGIPAIDQAIFGPTASSFYWSSSPFQFFPDFAWFVDFFNGGTFADGKTGFDYVRAVRAGS